MYLAEIAEEYDKLILEWMADIYTYMQWSYNISSKEIVKRIEPEEFRKYEVKYV